MCGCTVYIALHPSKGWINRSFCSFTNFNFGANTLRMMWIPFSCAIILLFIFLTAELGWGGSEKMQRNGGNYGGRTMIISPSHRQIAGKKTIPRSCAGSIRLSAWHNDVFRKRDLRVGIMTDSGRKWKSRGRKWDSLVPRTVSHKCI